MKLLIVLRSAYGVQLTTDSHLVTRPGMVQLYLHSPLCLHGFILN
jgi:hypothetical protein